jgi:hypothetical protein
MEWKLELITLYCTVCQAYNTRLAASAQRLSNNFCPKFTDEECITVYLWGITQQKFTQKAVYQYTKDYLFEWFPKIPSYQEFVRRIVFLSEALREFAEMLMDVLPTDSNIRSHVLDSMPIVVAKGTRKGKTASEVCNKTYCSSQKMWYYGVKLHVLGQKQYKALPLPVLMQISPAAENDLTVAKQFLPRFEGLEVFADKIYKSEEWEILLEQENKICVTTPVKLDKGQKVLDSADKVLSEAVSRTRQAIESFFSWIQEKTRIQNASKVRSLPGLLSFIYARLAVVCIFLAARF